MKRIKIKRLKPKKVNRSVGGDLAILLVLLILGAFMALPLVYAISSSLKPLDELWVFPPRFFARNPTLNNFRQMFALMANSWVPFSRYIFNSLMITVIGTAGHILIASMCAYPLAKYKFPGSNFFFKMVMLALMFNASVVAIPNYLIMARLQFVNTQAAVIIPAMGSALGLFLMKQFMEQFPDSLLEAAKIDGAKEFYIFWKILMPNLKPAWLTLMMFTVQSLWGTGASPFIYDEQLKTLPYALSQIVQGGIARAGVGAAVTVFMMILPITVFIITQSNVVETMATSGIKE